MPFRLIAVLALSALVALVLSLIPPAAWQPRQQEDIPTFRQSAPVSLRAQNLVDLFTMVPSHYNIKRVTWENGHLSVHFRVAVDERVEEAVLYREFYSLTHRVFARTDNVQRLAIQLWEELDEAKSRLLFTWVADRPIGQVLPAPDRVADVRTFAEKRFSVQASPEFFRKLRPSS